MRKLDYAPARSYINARPSGYDSPHLLVPLKDFVRISGYVLHTHGKASLTNRALLHPLVQHIGNNTMKMRTLTRPCKRRPIR
jgi:hypothetical protein